METIAEPIGPIAPTWCVVRGTNSRHDGRVIQPGHRLPLGVAPDRFGLIEFAKTGRVERLSCGVYAEVIEPVTPPLNRD